MTAEGVELRRRMARELERVERKFAKLRLAKLLFAKRLQSIGDRPTEDRDIELRRADGGAVCEVCGLTFRDHPTHPVEDYATMLCDGRYVKL